MKIERIDDKTVKCFLSNEELEEYEIDYKDFVTRSDKAKEVVQEIIEQAEEEVGYKPPKYAFDLQIMMLPDEGLVLVFSEKEPLENKNGAQLLQALQEMKRVFEEKKAEIGATLGKQAKEETENNAGKNKKAKGKAEEAAKPQFAIFAFRNIGRVICRRITGEPADQQHVVPDGRRHLLCLCAEGRCVLRALQQSLHPGYGIRSVVCRRRAEDKISGRTR